MNSNEKLKEIWATLSKINVNDHCEKKNGFTYLSWAWAWGQLMEHYPDAKFGFDKSSDGGEVFLFSDGTGEVRCHVTVEGYTRSMWLPIMDYKNKAVTNPNARDVNDAKMRCLVKTIALFGLGHYIYAGEDLPPDSSDDGGAKAVTKKAVAKKADAAEELMSAITSATSVDQLKAAYTKAAKYARNRNDTTLLHGFTKVKDEMKEKVS